MAFAVIFASGCVSKQDYDAVVKERDALKAQVTSLQTELGDYKNLKSDIVIIQSHLSKVLTALRIYETYLETVASLANIKTNVGSTITTTAIAESDSLTKMKEAAATFMNDFGIAVKDINNDKLSQMWNELLQAWARHDIREATGKSYAVLNLLMKLAADDTAALANITQ